MTDDEQMIEQLVRDLYTAHNEILSLQGIQALDVARYDWPEWSPQANSIRWAERRLGKRLARTTQWTEFPPLCRCRAGECQLHPGQRTCGMRDRADNPSLQPGRAT